MSKRVALAWAYMWNLLRHRANERVVKSLIVTGLLFTLVGAGLGFWGVWVDQKQALEYGQAYLSYSAPEGNLTLPPVRNLIRQSRFAMAGFLLIGLGTFLQIAGVVLAPRRP